MNGLVQFLTRECCTGVTLKAREDAV